MSHESEPFTYTRISGEKREGISPRGYGIFYDGHGAQFVGMGEDLYNKYPETHPLYTQANEVFGFDIRTVSFYGPEEKILQTRFAQRGLAVYNEVCLTALILDEQEKDPRRFQNDPRLVGGESLGMLFAIYRAGGFGKWGTKDAYQKFMAFIGERADIFQEVADANPSGLVMVSAAKRCSPEDYNLILQQLYRESGVKAALLKTATEVVVGGRVENLTLANRFLATQEKVKLTPIPTASGAFHTDIMREARPRVEAYLTKNPLQKPSIPVLTNSYLEPFATTDPKVLTNEIVDSTTMLVQGPAMVHFVEGENIAGHYVIGEKGLFARSLGKNSEGVNILDKVTSKRGLAIAGGTVAVGVAGVVVATLVRRSGSEKIESGSEDNKE